MYKKSKKNWFRSVVTGLQKKKVVKDVLIFLIKFNLLLIPFYAIIYFDLSFYPLQAAFTNFITSILNFLGYHVSTSGFFLYLGEKQYPIDISRDCIGWKSAYSLFALVFATPGLIKDKLKFLVIWIPFLFVVNIFRVLITILVGLNFGFQYLEVIHTFLWQEIMIIALLLVWYIWLRKGNLIGKKSI